MELKGTTAVITGSSGRLGGAIALALAEAGCSCICHYNQNKQRAEEVVGQIQEMGVKALAVGADLVEPEQIEDLFEKSAKFGTPRILINSAAVFSRQPLKEVAFGEAQRVLNLNLIAPILVSQAFAKTINGKFGNAESVVAKIVNISDVCGIRPWANYILYCSSKAGLIGATKALAKELAPAICVNSVAPGIVTWPRHSEGRGWPSPVRSKALASNGASDFEKEEKQRQLSFIPVRRIAEPKEITDAIIFLLKNDYITGQVLNVDGGRCI